MPKGYSTTPRPVRPAISLGAVMLALLRHNRLDGYKVRRR